MKVQIWSDFRCPFCYIGKRHLEAAIKDLGKDVEIEMMSFELDPNYEGANGETVAEHIAAKYGISVAEAQANNKRVVDMASSVGLNYNFDTMIDNNTFKAHKVLQLAKLKGVGNAFTEIGMSALFEHAKDLGDDETLVALGLEAGLLEADIRAALASDEYALKVRQDEQWAQMIGAKGVPHFVFDDKVSLSGAQPIETFKQAMNYVATLEPAVTQDDDLMCTDDSCAI